MKKLIFFCATLALLAAISSQAKMIEIPKDAVEREGNEEPGRSTPATFFGSMPSDGSPVDAYVKYLQDNLRQARKNWMMIYAKNYHPKDVRCLDTESAFGFEEINKTQMRFNCFAVPVKNNKAWISHLLSYEVKFAYQPVDCAGDEDIRAFFNDAKNRNKQSVKMKLDMINAGCKLSIPNTNETVLQKSKFDLNKLDELLQQDHTDVRAYLERTGRKKGVGLEDKKLDCTNIIRGCVKIEENNDSGE